MIGGQYKYWIDETNFLHNFLTIFFFFYQLIRYFMAYNLKIQIKGDNSYNMTQNLNVGFLQFFYNYIK